MKIIIIEHLFFYSGATSQRMLGYAKEFIKLGHQVVMIVSPQKPIPAHLKNIRFIEIEERRKSILDILKTYRQFIKAIKREYNDNSVIFFYGSQPYSFLFKSSRYRVFSEQTEIPYCGLRPSPLHRMLEYEKRMAMKHFSGVVTISKGLKGYYLQRGIKNVEVINMFVDASRFENKSIEPKDKYIAYCGTISIHKDGVDALIKAFNIYRDSFPDVKLYLIGDFDLLGSKEKIKSLISKLHLEDHVYLTGRINADVLPEVLKGARMLALARPNTKQALYGFPTKLGEYLATGKPVVVTKVGEIPLYLRDGDNAFLAEPDDVNSFAEKMMQIEADYNHALKIGEKGRELVYSEFSSVVQCKKLLSFIKERIENTKNS